MIISPVLIKGKIFIRQLWALKFIWETILPEDLQQRWKLFYSSLGELRQLSIPRHIFSITWSRLQLHGFCVASLEAFGASMLVPKMSYQEHVAYIYQNLGSRQCVQPLYLDWSCVELHYWPSL